MLGTTEVMIIRCRINGIRGNDLLPSGKLNEDRGPNQKKTFVEIFQLLPDEED